MNSVRPITVVDWQKEWQRIESIIRSMELSLPDYDADCKEIEDRLDRGAYVGHHSKVFEYLKRSYGPCCEKTSLLFVFRLLEVKLEIKSVVHHPQIGKLLQFATVFLGRTA